MKKNSEGISDRLWRWAHQLDGYDFTSRHKPGIPSVVADAFSHSSQYLSKVHLDGDFSLAEIREAQENNRDHKTLRAELNKQQPSVGVFAPILHRVTVYPVTNC